MTTQRDPDALLAAYLTDGMQVLPDRVARAVLEEVHRTRQRKFLGSRGTRSTFRTTLAAAAVVAVLAVGGMFVGIGRPSSSPGPSASVPGNVAPSVANATAAASSGFPREQGVWIPTGSMGTSRERVDAVRLLDGRVLVVGPATSDAYDTSAELYDPVTGTWSPTGNMLKPHEGFPPTLLRDGRVLVGDIEDPAGDKNVYSAEVYDPETETWSATGPMVEPEFEGGNSAVLLRDGRVLVMHPLGRSQLYDPDRGTWTATGKMVWGGSRTATLLRDGTVLVVGASVGTFYPTDSAELYDPARGSWAATANIDTPRGRFAVTLLPDGAVLVVGRAESTAAQVYEPDTGSWVATGDLARPGAFYPSMTLLADGTVLLTGTVGDGEDPSAELYDPQTGSWTLTGSMLQPPADGPATLLLDGTVLVIGGDSGSAQLYVPAGVTPPSGLPTAAPIPVPTPTPIPTAVPTPYPPRAGPVPPDPRSWTVTVGNMSSQPATLFVAEGNEDGLMGPLVGSAAPNVVAPGATVEVTFLLPAKGTDWAIFVNPGPNDGPLVGPAEMSLAGQIQIRILTSGQPGWRSP